MPDGDREPAGSRLRGARNEALFRAVNEKLCELKEAFSDVSNHVFPDVERVVRNTDGYVVVEKSADLSELTDAADPNA